MIDLFVSEGCLTDEETWIVKTRIAGWSRIKQCEHLHISISSLDKRIKRIKQKYDIVQSSDCRLPARK